MRRLKEIFNTKLDAPERYNQNDTDRSARQLKASETTTLVPVLTPSSGPLGTAEGERDMHGRLSAGQRDALMSGS